MNSASNNTLRIFSSPRFNLIAFILIAVMVLIAYSNTFTASFHFDDEAAIGENAAIKRITPENVLALLRTNRPVVFLSLMLNYSLNGMNVVGWHVFNTVVHIANSWFVYLLILWTLTLPSLRDKYSGKAAWMALFGSMLFAVHPIQTESVTYIISRTELLAAFFYLASFLLFIQGVKRDKLGYYFAATVTSLLAMASKEWAATLPAMLFLYDLVFISNGRIRNLKARWKGYLLLVLPWAFVGYIFVAHLMPSTSAGFNISGQKGITPWTYLLTSFNVIWTYIRLLFVPVNQNLDYDYQVARTLFEFPTLLSFLGHIFVLASAFWLYKKKGHLLVPFGVAWFYITLSPTQSFVPILDVIFEHRVYLPSIGFFIVFITAYELLFERLQGKEAVGMPVKSVKRG